MLRSSQAVTSDGIQDMIFHSGNRLWKGGEEKEKWVFCCFSVGEFKGALAPKGLRETHRVNGCAQE